jgi:hypothetical protein
MKITMSETVGTVTNCYVAGKTYDVADAEGAPLTALIKWVGDFGEKAVAAFASAAKWINEHSGALRTLAKVLGIAAAGVALYKTALFAVVAAQKAWALGQAAVLALQGPKGWATLAGAAAAAGVAYAGVTYAFTQISGEAAAASAAADKVAGSTGDAAANVGKLDTAADLASQKQSQLTASVSGLTSKLKEQIDSFGLSGTALDIWKLKTSGASDSMTAGIETLNAQLEALQANKKAMDDLAKAAERIADEIRAPWEVLYEKITQINAAEKAGLLTASQAAKAQAKANADAAGKETTTKAPGSVPERDKLDVVERRFYDGFFEAKAAEQARADRAYKLQLETATATTQTAKNTGKLVGQRQQVAANVGA